MTDCADTYGLDVVRIALPMKAAFEVYLRKREGTRAVLVGTRRTDPHGERFTYFDVTDHGWPKFMRVHPVIDWHYWEIWDVVPPVSPQLLWGEVWTWLIVVSASAASAVLCVVRSGVSFL